MPIYQYQHPNTGEILEHYCPAKDYNKPLILEDGTICPRIISTGIQFVDTFRIRQNGDPKKEKEFTKRAKDPERARRTREKLLGKSATSISKSEFYHKDKKIRRKNG